jgi:type I restriction enzyme M protein
VIGGNKTILDITWLKNKSLADLDNLPHADVLAHEAGLGNFRSIIKQLQ